MTVRVTDGVRGDGFNINETHWEMKFSHSLILDENNRQEYARMMTNNNKEIKILMETNDRNNHNFSHGRLIIRSIRVIRGQKRTRISRITRIGGARKIEKLNN